MERLLGIDFGTSYTSAGVLVDARVELVQDLGDVAIPSVVHVPRTGDLLVGQPALVRLASDPTSTIAAVKRMLGATSLARLGALPLTLEIANGHVVVSTSAGKLACEQIAAAIFSKVRDLAERRFGGLARRAVVAIPAGASVAYVGALQRAAKLAHVEIVQVVSEPIAGALALGLHADPCERKLVVCDFGGGTFDVTAIEQAGLKFSPVATCGEEFLGGDDLDAAMADAIATRILRQSRFNMLDDRVRRAQLVQRCESVKRALSTHETARLTMRQAYVFAGEHRALDIIVERSWMEPVWMPIITRAITCIATTLARAKWSADQVDHMVLIGGSSTVPLYRAALAAAFGNIAIKSTPIASTAVAIGAALVTAQHTTGVVPVLPTLDRSKRQSVDIVF